jgi:hypothetical protein
MINVQIKSSLITHQKIPTLVGRKVDMPGEVATQRAQAQGNQVELGARHSAPGIDSFAIHMPDRQMDMQLNIWILDKHIV